MTISLNNETVKILIALFKKSLPMGATNGVVEIYSIDDYMEYPVEYRSETGEVITPVFTGWDSAESMASDALTRFLSDEISVLKDHLDRNDVDYWNHFIFNLKANGDYEYIFSYSADIIERFETKFREALGDGD